MKYSILVILSLSANIALANECKDVKKALCGSFQVVKNSCVVLDEKGERTGVRETTYAVFENQRVEMTYDQLLDFRRETLLKGKIDGNKNLLIKVGSVSGENGYAMDTFQAYVSTNGKKGEVQPCRTVTVD